MKKNLFVVMFAVVGMLLTCACSNEELGAVESKADAKVTFKLGLENAISSILNFVLVIHFSVIFQRLLKWQESEV